SAEQLGDLSACLLNCFVGRFSVLVGARRIPEMLLQIRQHRLDHGGIQRRSRIVVEINRSHELTSSKRRSIRKAGIQERLRTPLPALLRGWAWRNSATVHVSCLPLSSRSGRWQNGCLRGS